MVKVVAPNHIKAEHIASVEPLFREIIEATQKEHGCIEYRLFVTDDEPGLYVFIEEWESMEDLQNHFATEHFKRIVPQIKSFSSKGGAAWVLKEFK